ncbi:hypothetical protein NEA10_09060 [Phormidium yuhuli AB48]|uniref:Uncharacterized protein n=2 Tax=Oscillatoriaceae TaxID=1892254 RepID=A0ABY5AX82_9CYAN|nr:hypothetical protein [Phormidium yuhuli]USR92844.1 hypothetical protein NEA10_09060 [Phormidium yuhuli AB48]
MTNSFLPSLPTLSDFFFQVWENGKLTKADRLQLRSYLLSDRLTEADYTLLNRLLHAVRRGWVSCTGDRRDGRGSC